MPVVGFAMLIFMLGEGRLQRRTGWLSGLRLPVASSDLRTKRVAQLGANLRLYHVTRDDNDILWGLATKSVSWGGKDWKGGSWSRVHLSSWNVPDLQLVPAIPQRTFCASKRLRDPRRQATARWNWRSNDSLPKPNPDNPETIRNSQTQLQTCLRKDPKHPKTYPNDEECIRMHKNATEIWHLCNWLLHIAVALLRLQALSG